MQPLFYLKLWELLRPFHRDYGRYMSGVVVRQSLVVIGGCSMLWALRLSTKDVAIPVWAFVAALVLFDSGYFIVDLSLNYLFASRLAYPLFGHLRTTALNKIFQMPMEWHHRQNSGAILGRVNNGIGKVVQTTEAISRELCPALIKTGLSLLPLLIFSPWTAVP